MNHCSDLLSSAFNLQTTGEENHVSRNEM